MSIYKRGEIYWYKFMWQGKLIRESTKQGNDKVARKMESAHRTALAQGLVGIREKKPVPTLREFLEKDFIPFVKAKHSVKLATVKYYSVGAQMLSKSAAGGLRIDEVSDQHAQQFAAQRTHLSPSYVNRGLRTLRRALNLAFEWGKLERSVKIHVAAGERQRDRVLSPDEVERYLAACPQPWRDCATIMVEEGMRPGEVFALKWSHLLFDRSGGLIQIVAGKSKAA